MTKAYAIAQMTVNNPEGYLAYSREVAATLVPFGGKFLVRGGEPQVLDGQPSGARNVVLEFPDLQSAKNWYQSPAYQAIVPGRLNNAKGYLVLVEGYTG
ncbi:MAG: hypothetical protein RLZZ344_515 [Pseudomonadota bacterium]|jgi:uncharacterized protein (DUF1330 family)